MSRDDGMVTIQSSEGALRLTFGMVCRDYFAGQALAGICSKVNVFDAGRLEMRAVEADPRTVARTAYQMADAMLAVRQETEAKP